MTEPQDLEEEIVTQVVLTFLLGIVDHFLGMNIPGVAHSMAYLDSDIQGIFIPDGAFHDDGKA